MNETPNDPFFILSAAVDDARVALEEANESGDLEERLEAALHLEDAARNLLKFTVDGHL